VGLADARVRGRVVPGIGAEEFHPAMRQPSGMATARLYAGVHGVA